MEDAELLLDRRGADRGGLEAVAQRLVVELDAERRPLPALAGLVPVVDQITLVHEVSLRTRPFGRDEAGLTRRGVR